MLKNSVGFCIGTRFVPAFRSLASNVPSIPSCVMVIEALFCYKTPVRCFHFGGVSGGQTQEFCAPWRRKREAEEERRRAELTAHPSAASWVKDSEEDDTIGKTRSKESVRILQRELGDDDIETGLSGGKPKKRVGSVNKFPRPVDVGATVVNPIHASGMRGQDHSGDAASVAGGGNLKGGEESDEETVPLGLLTEEEIKRAYDIFCGGEELDFQRFLTGLGVLR